MNKDWWEKDTNARRGRRCPDNRRGWIINSFSMSIVAIRTIRTAMLITTSSVVLVAAIVMSSTIISSDGGRHIDTADHGD
jgi:hypothetical protein